MLSLFGPKLTAEEKREERRIKAIVRDIALVRGTTPRKMQAETKAAARLLIAEMKRGRRAQQG